MPEASRTRSSFISPGGSRFLSCCCSAMGQSSGRCCGPSQPATLVHLEPFPGGNGPEDPSNWSLPVLSARDAPAYSLPTSSERVHRAAASGKSPSNGQGEKRMLTMVDNQHVSNEKEAEKPDVTDAIVHIDSKKMVTDVTDAKVVAKRPTDGKAGDRSGSPSRRKASAEAGGDSLKKGKKAREAERLAKETKSPSGNANKRGDSRESRDSRDAITPQGLGGNNTASLFNTLSSNMTNLSVSPFTTLDYEDMPKEQRREARQLIKDFVQAMVRGRHIAVVTASGDVRTCFCALTRQLDRLRISFDESESKVREVLLSSVAEIVVDENPVDDLLATLVLDNEQSITFRPKSMDERDKLAACLTMLIGQAKQPGGGKRH